MSGGELAGALTERVAIERRDATRDDLGGASGEWVTLAEVWAAVVPDGVAAAAEGATRSAMPSWAVTIRARELAFDDRLAWQGRRLRIERIAADPRAPDRLTLTAREER